MWNCCFAYCTAMAKGNTHVQCTCIYAFVLRRRDAVKLILHDCCIFQVRITCTIPVFNKLT